MCGMREFTRLFRHTITTGIVEPCRLCREDSIGASGESKLCADHYTQRVIEFYEKTHPITVENLKSKWLSHL